MSKIKCAIIGPGNICTDLLYKLLRSDQLEPRWMVGVDPESEGLRRAAELGLETTHEGVDWLLKQDDLPDIVFEATSASVHREYAPRYEEAGIRVVNLFPGPIDDDWNQNLPPPKLTPEAVASAIVKALKDGVEDVYPGDVAQEWLERWREDPRVLERELATGG